MGSKGYIRNAESNIELSLSFLNRSYNQSTIDLHIKNQTGVKLSKVTREKMSVLRATRYALRATRYALIYLLKKADL